MGAWEIIQSNVRVCVCVEHYYIRDYHVRGRSRNKEWKETRGGFTPLVYLFLKKEIWRWFEVKWPSSHTEHSIIWGLFHACGNSATWTLHFVKKNPSNLARRAPPTSSTEPHNYFPPVFLQVASLDDYIISSSCRRTPSFAQRERRPGSA